MVLKLETRDNSHLISKSAPLECEEAKTFPSLTNSPSTPRFSQRLPSKSPTRPFPSQLSPLPHPFVHPPSPNRIALPTPQHNTRPIRRRANPTAVITAHIPHLTPSTPTLRPLWLPRPRPRLLRLRHHTSLRLRHHRRHLHRRNHRPVIPPLANLLRAHHPRRRAHSTAGIAAGRS